MTKVAIHGIASCPADAHALPASLRIALSDGSLLFLLHLLSKMRPAKDGGSRFGIVLNGSVFDTSYTTRGVTQRGTYCRGMR